MIERTADGLAGGLVLTGVAVLALRLVRTVAGIATMALCEVLLMAEIMIVGKAIA